MPPPPPAPPAPGPPRGLKAPAKSGGAMDRGALLSSIHKGTMLKKTVTNDRSAPVIDSKISSSKPSANGTIQGPTGGGGGMVNGGAPQLGGLFAGGMPKLRPTGRGRNTADSTDSGPLRPPLPGSAPQVPTTKKPSAPPTPPGSAKPFNQAYQHQSNYTNGHQSHSNGYLPPSPKPSSKSSPAPLPPPSNRKPSVPDRGPPVGARVPFLEVPTQSSKPSSPKPVDTVSLGSSEERHPPLPTKPSFRARPEPGYRGAPPRPPSSSKPHPPPKSPDLKPNNELRRTSIDRSVSLREPQRPPVTQMRVGTSAESPAAPFRVGTNHRDAPPVPSSRPPVSKTVGRAAGTRMMPALRHPSEKPPKPPQRPVVAAPPPPSQPPPPPPAFHRGNNSPTVTPLPGGKGDVPLPPIPQSAVPPPPPERNESTRATYNKQPGDFESKFSNLFKSRHQFPMPLTFNNVPKTYPSKNNAKNQRRAPLPPTSNANSSSQLSAPPSVPTSSKPSSPHGFHPTSFHSIGGNNPPPPPPPHAPLHLQMDRKFYGTEASHC